MEALISIIIINWNNVDYLKRCMNSILNQSYKKLEVIFIDNDSSDKSYEFMRENYNDKHIILKKNSKNLGYSGGANLGIHMSNGEFIVIMNPDVILEKDYIEMIYNFINTDTSIGAACGKIFKYDFNKDLRLNIIDTTGILMYKSRRCIDRGQNQLDCGQYNKAERVFGICGAVAFYKKAALESIKVQGEYFDEIFFAYKEDIDVSWRLNHNGYKCMYYPDSVAYHGRKMESSKGGVLNNIKHRKNQSRFLRGISFRNHYLMIMKNENKLTYKKDKFLIWNRFLMFMGYSLLLERFNFKYLKEIFKYKKIMKNKRDEFRKNPLYKESDLRDVII